MTILRKSSGLEGNKSTAVSSPRDLMFCLNSVAVVTSKIGMENR
jgi:hypothetical protein